MKTINPENHSALHGVKAIFTGKLISVVTAVGISFIILYLLFRKIDLSIFLSRAKNIEPSLLGMIIVVFFFHCLFRSLRFSVATRTELRYVYMISAIHSLLNRIMPFRTGELTWPILMKRYLNTDFVSSVSLLLLIRYLDVFCLIFLFTVACLIVKPVFFTYLIGTVLIMILMFQIASLLFLGSFLDRLSFIMERLSRFGFKNRIEILIEKLDKLKKRRNTQNFLRLMCLLLLLTLMNWLSIYFIFFVYIVMLSLEFTFFQVICGASLVAVCGVLPVNSLGRFGVFELTWAGGFILLGMPKDVAVPMGLFVNISNTCIAFILALVGYIFLVSFGRRENEGRTTYVPRWGGS